MVWRRGLYFHLQFAIRLYRSQSGAPGNHNPSVTSFISEDALSSDDVFQLSENDFMFAFTLQDGVSRKAKMDRRYIKWQAAFYSFLNGKLEKWHLVDVYPCTETDYEKFYEPGKQTKGRFEEHRENKDLYCIDFEKAKLGLWGDVGSGTYANIDLMAVPCHMG